MPLNYKKIGELITKVSEKNKDGLYDEVLGVAIEKEFMPSVANTIGTDLKKYNIVRKNRFAFNPMHVGRDEKLPIAVYRKDEPALVSPAYMMFEVKNESVDIEYLMLIFKTDSFDHLCWFHTDASVRGGLTWEDFSDIDINIPSLEEQQKIVRQYQTITDRIDVLERINEKLEKMALIMYSDLVNREGAEWTNGTLEDLYVFQYGKGNTNPDNGGVYPIYGSNGIIGGYDKYNNEDAPVIGHIGSCGSLTFAFGKHFVTYNGVMCNVKNSNHVYSGYLALMNSHLEEQNRGTTQPFLSYDMLYEIETVIPSDEALDELEGRLNPIFKTIACGVGEIQELKILSNKFLQHIG